MKKTIATFLKTPLWLQFFISGIFLGVGFLFPYLWFLVFLGLGLFLFLVEKEKSFKKIIFGGFLAFSVKTLFATAMILSVYPVRVVETNLGVFEFLVVLLYWLSVSFTIGLGGAVLAYFLKVGQRFFKKEFFILLFPVLIVLCEVLGSFFFSILTLGEASDLNIIYSLGYVGYLLAEHNLFIKTAYFGGVYFLSFLTALFSILFFLFFKKEIIVQGLVWSKKYFNFILIFLIVIFSANFNFNKTYEPILNKTVAVVDTNFDDKFLGKTGVEEKFKMVEEIVFEVLKLKTDYVLLPEGANYNLQNFTPESAYGIFRFRHGDPKVILIDSSQVEWEIGKLSQRANIFDGINKQGLGIDKQLLTPQGEYLPYFYGFFIKNIGGEKTFLRLQRDLRFRPGPFYDQSIFAKEIPSVLFCFESIDPLAVKRVLKNRESVPFVAHPISHVWFHNSEILKHTVDTMLKIQAIWNQVPIVSAGNLTEGALYTITGEKIIPENKIKNDTWQVGIINL